MTRERGGSGTEVSEFPRDFLSFIKIRIIRQGRGDYEYWAEVTRGRGE